MKRVVPPILVLAVLVFAGNSFAAAPQHNARHRALAMTSTSAVCHAWYQTNVFAGVGAKPSAWPASWYERVCVREDESLAGQMYLDDDYYYWSGSAWVQYGTWYEHLSYANFSTYIDYCYWQAVGQRTVGPYYTCP